MWIQKNKHMANKLNPKQEITKHNNKQCLNFSQSIPILISTLLIIVYIQHLLFALTLTFIQNVCQYQRKLQDKQAFSVFQILRILYFFGLVENRKMNIFYLKSKIGDSITMSRCNHHFVCLNYNSLHSFSSQIHDLSNYYSLLPCYLTPCFASLTFGKLILNKFFRLLRHVNGKC